MAKKNQKKRRVQADQGVHTELPAGVKSLRTLEGHGDAVLSLAFMHQGHALASGSVDGTVKLWETRSGKLLHTFAGHRDFVRSLASNQHSDMLISGSLDHTVKFWDTYSGTLLRTLDRPDGVLALASAPHGDMLAAGFGNTVEVLDASKGKVLQTLRGHKDVVVSLAFSPQGDVLASGSVDQTVKFWEACSGKLLRTLDRYKYSVAGLAFNSRGDIFASGSGNLVQLRETSSGKLLRTLEGHTDDIDTVRFSSDGRLLISKSADHTIRLWNCETWESVAVIPAPTRSPWWIPALAFHPTLPLLVTPSSPPDIEELERCCQIHIWELDYDALLGSRAADSATTAVYHTTGKIVLVGDHSVGKSALGHRLIHGEFKEQASTHGQQFWIFPALGKRRADETECEAILWDFAGQPDYRLVHALFVDDADLALVLFDASDIHDPLHGVGFWLKQLQTGLSKCPICSRGGSDRPRIVTAHAGGAELVL